MKRRSVTTWFVLALLVACVVISVRYGIVASHEQHYTFESDVRDSRFSAWRLSLGVRCIACREFVFARTGRLRIEVDGPFGLSARSQSVEFEIAADGTISTLDESGWRGAGSVQTARRLLTDAGMVEQTPELHAMSQDLDWVLSRLASRGPPGIQYDASTSGEPRAPELALLRPLGSQTAHVGGLNPVAIVVCIAATCAGIVVVRRTRVPRAM